MKPILIGGESTIDVITERVRDAEVTRRRFVIAEIENDDNKVHFVRQNVPPKPYFIEMGSQPPAGTSLEWVGEMLVENNPTPVQMYREPASEEFLGGSDVISTIRRTQLTLGVAVDGKPGPKTWSAIEERLSSGTKPAGRAAEKEIDPRSERSISTLLEHVRPYAKALLFKAAEQGISIKIISGTRTFAEQDALWQKGRSQDGSVVDPSQVVTNARGGESNHNYGIAFDIGVFQGGNYLTRESPYLAIGALGQELGLEWGGDWKTFRDISHFQLRPPWAKDISEREMIKELRRQFPNGV